MTGQHNFAETPDVPESDKQLLQTCIREHYASFDAPEESPLLLSALGGIFTYKNRNVTFKSQYNGYTIKRFIQDQLHEEFELYTPDPSRQQVIYVIPKSMRSLVKNNKNEGAPINLNRFHKSFLTAFLASAQDDAGIYLMNQRPFKFDCVPFDSTVESLVIDKNFLLSGVSGKLDEVRKQNREAELRDKVYGWLEQEGLPDNRFFFRRLEHQTPHPRPQNALAHLLAAQSPAVRSQLLIPGDIAELLMNSDV